MPVDQNKLNGMIGKLKEISKAKREENDNIGRILENLYHIQNEENVDRRTNKKFLVGDRQKIYDDNMVEATAIVGE